MKIISGIYKGRTIEGFDIKGTRPTMERVKESLFGMIQNYLLNSNCLDLFSGSGNLAIEALSEGASSIYLVDNNIKAIKTIKNNIEKLNIENASIIHSDYKKALELFKEKNIKFNLIFLDPTYNTNYLENSISLIEQYNLLEDDGIIVCESDSINKIIYTNYFELIKERTYNDKIVIILKKTQ